MSYDIFLYKAKSGQPDENEADAVIGVDTDKWAVKEINPQVKLAIVQALTEHHPRLQAIDFHYGDISKLSPAVVRVLTNHHSRPFTISRNKEHYAPTN